MPTVFWNGSIADWDNANDWSDNTVPNDSNTDVTLDGSDTYTLSIAGGESFVAGAVSFDDPNATFQVSGTLSPTTLTLTSGTFILDGEIDGGTIAADGASETFAGTLDAVTYQGTLDLSQSNDNVTIIDGITFQGAGGTGQATVNLTGDSALLIVNEKTQLDNVTIDIGSADSGDAAAIINNDPSRIGAVLTFGSDVTIDQTGLYAALSSNDYSGDGIVNEGAIDAGVSGGSFTIDATNFTNVGTVTVSNGDTLILEGTVAADLVNEITNSGGVLGLAGTITGGTITNELAGMGGELDNVTYQGTLDLSESGDFLAISGGITFEGTGDTGQATVNLTGDSALLFVEGTTQLDNVTIDIGSGTSSAPATLVNDDPGSTGTVLTFGSDVTIDQTGLSAELSSSNDSGDGIVNEGTIDADYPGGVFTVSATGNFTNEGTVTVFDGIFDGAINSGGGSGTIEVASNATFNEAVDSGQAVEFVGGSPILFLVDPLQFSGRISGSAGGPIGPNDTMAVDNFALGNGFTEITAATPGTFNPTTDSTPLDLSDNGTQVTELTLVGNYSSDHFAVTQNGAFSDVAIACYCRGTWILTDRGEVAVEDLAIGDMVKTAAGSTKPIKWIGRRGYGGRFAAANPEVLPIVVRAGALAENVPSRDLWVSPGHALFIDGFLIAAEHLINGLTIARAADVEEAAYFHLEFDEHEVILAERAPAESYVECDNRNGFQNAHEFAVLYPNDSRPSFRFCAPRLEAGTPELSAIRQTLFERAEALGYPTTADPDLHLIADGIIVRPHAIDGCRYTFELDAKARQVWLASRSAVPAELEPLSSDRRRLGACVERIVLRDEHLRIKLSHGDPSLREGFHEDEPGGRRWTDGMGRLPESLLRAFAGGLAIDVHRVPTRLRYPLHPIRLQTRQPHAQSGRLGSRRN